MTAYCLSAEEYILSLLLIGETTAAVAIKEEAFPDASEEEMSVRFDSGMNGLMSKGLLDIKGENQEVEENLRVYLSRLSKASRMVKFQVLDGEMVKTVSLFLGETRDIHVMEYNARVHTFFPVSDLAKVAELIGYRESTKDEFFIVAEPAFDQLVQQLLASGRLPEHHPGIAQMPDDFLTALVEKGGRLNSIYDFEFDEGGRIRSAESYLYLTGSDKTWFIEQRENQLVFQTKPLQTIINANINRLA
ncbi:hypothetical protein [Aneurinibacillus tyrosinisolvens]|uniref:hypothetical protein n=1 Tax=Aneurinibacillus tyrosinisolvens TaxID=1443435 RepID=UPI00063FBFE8|nr:hypothetical protein [Aneurinibacillus tyrosinisolvens]